MRLEAKDAQCWQQRRGLAWKFLCSVFLINALEAQAVPRPTFIYFNNIGNNQIEDEGVSNISAEKFPRLKELQLGKGSLIKMTMR